MGDHAQARDEVETALSIDPEFLAARMLRDQLDAPDTSAIPAAVETSPSAPTPAAAALPAEPPAPPPASLAASAAKLAAIEVRVRQRVHDRGNAPSEATPDAAPPARVTAPHRRPSITRRYRWGAVAVAAAAFAFAMASSRTQEPRLLYAHSTITTAQLVEAGEPDPLDARSSRVEEEEPLPVERPFMRPPAPVMRPPAPAPAPVRVTVATTTTVAPPSTVPLAAPPAPVQAVPISTVVTDSPPPSVVPRVVVDERAQVEEALSRYRRAYNRLDARSAQAVYPNLNAPALARAFDSLQSQSLQFDECEIDVRGGSASVTCRGTSRYVPKVGSRDPRVEPRVWDFTLRKDEGDWKIENARASR